MPQATLVPVNPAVVKWAIDQSGLTVEAIARRANVPPEVVASWISGTGSPSKTQFALLAQAVKRPTSVFFLPAAPKVQTRSVRFRAPIGSRRTQLNPDERDSIASAARLQRLFAWLAERTRTRADLSRFKGPEDPDGAAGHVRDLIKITPAQQRKWRDARAAWDMWRTTLEALGLYVLLQELGKDGIRAFALPDDSASLIAVNSAFSAPARTFSLFHEFAHLLRGEGSACYGSEGPAGGGGAEPSKIADAREERWCDQFAAALLLPETAFGDFLFGRYGTREVGSVAVIEAASTAFKVSGRATVLRAIHLGWAPRELYNEVDSLWKVSDFPKPSKSFGGERRSVKRVRELGQRPMSLVLGAVRNGDLTELDAMRQLRLGSHDYDEVAELLAPT